MSKTDTILQMLLDAGEQGVSQQKLNAICYRYGSAIFRLRRAGHAIETVQIGPSHFKFVYHALCTTERKTLGSEKAHFSLESVTATAQEETA